MNAARLKLVHGICRTLSCLTAALLLTGCESLLGRKAAVSSPVALPGTYHHGPREGEPRSSAPSSLRSPGDLGSADLPAGKSWWSAFGSEELDAIVTRALRENPDIKIASLRIDQARVRSEQARSAALPLLTMPFRMVATNAGGVTDAQQSSQIGLVGAWRADVWGEQRGLIESAQLQMLRARHEHENVRRIVAANAVSVYIAWLAANDSLTIARTQMGLAEQLVDAIRRRLDLGEATGEELEQQLAQQHALQASLQALERQRDQQAINLARWLGTVPGELFLEESGLDSLQLPAFEAGIPSRLLLRRPDIRMVEARMRAANADIDVARARMLPPVDLAAQVGLSGVTLSSMLQPQAFLANALASVAATIFDGGRRAGNQAIAESVYLEMTETYRNTVLQAVREVESALASGTTLQRQFEAQRAASRAHLNRLKLMQQAYALGSADLGMLLEVRRAWERAQEDMVRLRAELLSAHASLGFALGESFDPGPSAAAILKGSPKAIAR